MQIDGGRTQVLDIRGRRMWGVGFTWIHLSEMISTGRSLAQNDYFTR